ncbi:hypothetical protein [Cupriavidus pauculus]|uniref:hypothetical protein n=1 Tax=Cupriavidus pauculus TaxID=82633 RepID=UPI003F73BAB6
MKMASKTDPKQTSVRNRFHATDMPLKPEELQRAGLAQFPTVAGGGVPVLNLPGMAPANCA